MIGSDNELIDGKKHRPRFQVLPVDVQQSCLHEQRNEFLG
jgi:hypothetical protein